MMPAPMPIPTETLIIGGVVICKATDCPFERSCANHESAGDFRTVDGFTPVLVRVSDASHWGCKTHDVEYGCDDPPEPLHIGWYCRGAYCERGGICVDHYTEPAEVEPSTFREHLDAAEESLYRAWQLGMGPRGLSEREYNEIVTCRHALSRLMQVATEG